MSFNGDYHQSPNAGSYVNITALAIPEPGVNLLGALCAMLLFRRRR